MLLITLRTENAAFEDPLEASRLVYLGVRATNPLPFFATSNPDFLDWDDTGTASGNPNETDPDNRSRMGCFGGPDGDWDPNNL